MKDYLKEIREISKKNALDYRYKYYELEGESLVPSKKCEVFGEDRKGFEKFKQTNNDSYVDVSGKISLRRVVDIVSNKTIGYVSEEKIPGEGSVSKARDIYEQAYNDVCESLGVQDNQSFAFYVSQNSPTFDFRESIEEYIQKVRWLNELVNDYKDDVEFRHFLDKIIKN